MNTNLEYINQICTDLGGTGGHVTNVAGENEICTLLGGTGGHSLEIDALNEICTLQSVTGGHSLVLNALNAISSGTYKLNLSAWSYIQSSAVLNQDDNADAYILAEGITDANVKSAITNLVKDLKAINAVQADFVNFDNPALSKRKAIFPIPGTLATENKRNLINPDNTDAAYRLIFTGVATIGSLGIKTTGACKLALNALTGLELNNHQYEVMLAENTYSAANYEIFAGLTTYLNSNYFEPNKCQNKDGDSLLFLNLINFSYKSLVQVNRKSGDIGGHTLIQNGFTIKSNTAAIAGSLANSNMGFQGNRYIDWYAVGESISDAANQLYVKAIETYQHAMGRLGNYNFLIDGHSFTVTALIARPLLDALKINNICDSFAALSFGVGGSSMVGVNQRYATLKSYTKTNTKIGFKNVIVLWIGTNAGFSIAEYNAMKAYIETAYSDGIEDIYCFTGTPRTYQFTFETERVIFNDLMRTELDVLPYCTVVDTDTITELDDSTNTTYYSDGLHLTTAGMQLAVNLLASKIEANS